MTLRSLVIAFALVPCGTALAAPELSCLDYGHFAKAVAQNREKGASLEQAKQTLRASRLPPADQEEFVKLADAIYERKINEESAELMGQRLCKRPSRR